jgi:hypothetical protein
MDEPSEGTLRFSGHWILTNVFATQTDILTSGTSTRPYELASPIPERSPTDTDKYQYPTASADNLVPYIFGAKTLHQ